MKFIAVVLVAGVLGAAAGLALAYSSVGPAAPLPDVASLAALPTGEQAQLAARVDQPDHNFGSMQKGAVRSHVFTVHNDGPTPLALETGETSCKCTKFVASAGTIPPGGSAEVTLEWIAKAERGEFRQTARLNVRGERPQVITLSVYGEVIDAAGIEPQQFNLGRISRDGGHRASVVLMSFDREDLTVQAEAPTRDGQPLPYGVEVTPLEPAEFPDQRAKAATRVSLTAGPSLPLGVIEDWVKISSNLPDIPVRHVPVFGRVEGDITVRGLDWSAETGVLSLGFVDSAKGKKSKLLVRFSGRKAERTGLRVVEVDPPELQVSIGSSRPGREGSVYVPVTVEVPVGTRPMVRLQTGRNAEDGSFQNPQGMIRLAVAAAEGGASGGETGGQTEGEPPRGSEAAPAATPAAAGATSDPAGAESAAPTQADAEAELEIRVRFAVERRNR
ncbi:MAG: DUF1573 domain-containing protein [Planctomycetota bacterium]